MSESDYPCRADQYSGVFDNSRKLGQGAFSTVYRGICKPKNTDVAIKIMDLENITSSFEDILLEVQTMKLSNHENILQCHASFVNDSKLWLVLEYMDKGSCQRIINISKKEGFGEGLNEEWIAYIMRETLKGLNYIHNAGYIHRDIKPGNILISQYGDVRLGDFGVAGWMLSRGQRTDNRTFVGTLCYMSPEIMEQTHGYDQKADIWSLGITCLELAKGYAPYAKFAPMRVLVVTIEEDPPSLKSYKDELQRTGQPFSKLFEDFCSKCLKKDSKQRLNAEELLKHKFFRGRNKDSLVDQLLSKIPSMDSYNTKEFQISSSSSYSDINEERLAKQEESNRAYVAGTTWVFDETLPSGEIESSMYKKSVSRVSGISSIERTTTSRGRMLNVSVLKGTSSSGHPIVRISQIVSKDNGSAEDIDDFLDNFESESATIKTKPSAPVQQGTDSFFDEIQSIIGKDSSV